MKPFTLIWWLRIYGAYRTLAEASTKRAFKEIQKDNKSMHHYYFKRANWVEKRIAEKYGP